MIKPSVFLVLRSALAAHLCADPALAGVPVHVDRLRPIAQGEERAINVRMPNAMATHAVIHATDWRTSVFIDCAVRGAGTDEQADALLTAVHASLGGFAQTQDAEDLGVMQTTDGADAIEWYRVAEDAGYTCATLNLTLVHRTPAGSLQPWGAAP